MIKLSDIYEPDTIYKNSFLICCRTFARISVFVYPTRNITVFTCFDYCYSKIFLSKELMSLNNTTSAIPINITSVNLPSHNIITYPFPIFRKIFLLFFNSSYFDFIILKS